MSAVKLVVVGGATEGDEYQPVLPATLGRARDAGIPLPHPLVSRQHCELIERDGFVFVRELGSTNGTFVGSERVDGEMILEHGALLTIGTVTFRAFYDGQPCTEYGSMSPMDETHCEKRSAAETSTITRIDTGQIGPQGFRNADGDPAQAASQRIG